MYAVARRLLLAGRSVVLDAVFQQPAEREPARRLAGELGVSFRGAWLQGREGELRRRLAARSGDASDAGGAALDQQLARDPGPIAWERRDAEALDAVAEELTARRGLRT
jgi:hypothetical protein